MATIAAAFALARPSPAARRRACERARTRACDSAPAVLSGTRCCAPAAPSGVSWRVPGPCRRRLAEPCRAPGPWRLPLFQLQRRFMAIHGDYNRQDIISIIIWDDTRVSIPGYSYRYCIDIWCLDTVSVSITGPIVGLFIILYRYGYILGYL